MSNSQTTKCPKCGNFMAYNNDELQPAQILECFHCPKETGVAIRYEEKSEATNKGESIGASESCIGVQIPTPPTQTTPAGDEVAENWQQFFDTSNNWIFQAAPIQPESIGKTSLGSMECMYRAFKARMEAEREQN